MADASVHGARCRRSPPGGGGGGHPPRRQPLHAASAPTPHPHARNRSILCAPLSLPSTLQQQLDQVRAGNTELRLRSHILILNTSKLLLPLLRQLNRSCRDAGHAFYRRPVVLMAPLPKAELDELLGTTLKGGQGANVCGAVTYNASACMCCRRSCNPMLVALACSCTTAGGTSCATSLPRRAQCLHAARTAGMRLEVHTRSGRPYREADLQLAAAQHAATVILLQPQGARDTTSAEALKAATLVALSCVNPAASVVVQMPPAQQQQRRHALAAAGWAAGSERSSSGNGGGGCVGMVLRASSALAGGSVRVVELQDQSLLDR